ncbi:MAG: hypothetical protein ACFN4D_01500 [Cardiobacterium sp.]|uniref:hypothetical protein n=1 Tax=uncultured Cardiobacterium sp. TaxID=417619 RepID=UPI00262C10F5|nr:hypothetical protein [uncultured Cardiobacterium sp.]
MTSSGKAISSWTLAITLGAKVLPNLMQANAFGMGNPKPVNYPDLYQGSRLAVL